MQSSKVCINEAGPSVVTVDVAGAASCLLQSDKGYGFAYRKTLEHLGLERLTNSPLIADMVLAGSVESIREHVPNLQRHIGVIARYGAYWGSGSVPAPRDSIGRILGHLTQNRLPDLPNNATLMRAVGVVTAPFAHAVSSDDTYVYYGRPAPWGNRREIGASDENGKLLGRFATRDIGGMEIGPDGLAARNAFSFGLPMDKLSFYRLSMVTRANGTRTVGEEVRNSMRYMLEQPERPVIEPRPLGEDVVRFRATYPRTDLAELETLPYKGNPSLVDGMRQAIDMYLAHCISTPDMSWKLQMELAKVRGSLPHFDIP